MSKNSKKGLPKAVQAELDEEEGRRTETETLESFINELHGEGTSAVPIEGMPTKEWLQDQFQTKSAIIRYLVNQKFTVKDIAKHLGMRYQHVRNVATSNLKRGPNEDWRKPLMQDTELSDPKKFKPD